MKSELSHEPIAIVGIGCNFPGAHGPAEFWQLLCAGRAAIREAPPERSALKPFLAGVADALGRTVSACGGFLDEIDRFEPAAFGISPREADSMDPQQRLLLEAAWEALEDAGITRHYLRNNCAGVFIGMSSADYGDMQMDRQDVAGMDVYTLSGSARSILAGRISHAFDLRGPSIAVDTACSSSLVAVHLACQSIWHGGCDLALAGGVNVILAPEPWGALALARILSPDGQARVFDAAANGFVRGEGAGVVVLKPLAQAQADRDPIYAVILGGAINNDGRNSSVMTPNGQAQEAVLRAAYRHAGVAPGAVHYVEAHGTGTSVGDPIEARALGAVIAPGRLPDAPCIVGSVKTNIGHLEAAAGISGLIKTALCIKHRAIPPSLHFLTPNPAVPWDDLPLVVAHEYRTWPAVEGPALAGVSSFGISGTNVHLVLTDVPAAPAAAQPAADAAHLLPLSAHTPDGLAATVARWHDFLAGAGAALPLADICYTAAARRNHHPHRATFVGRTHQEVCAQLAIWQHGAVAAPSHLPSGDNKPVFVFSGQGAQFWPLDPALLTRFSVFRATLEACADLLRTAGAEWSLLEQLTAVDGVSRLYETDICQAAIFACQVALAAQWRAWGIEPAAVIGHSLGEVAAAHVAGALTLKQAIWLALQRGRITARAAGKGAMALVGLSATAARTAIEAYAPALVIAAVNSPTACVVSGELESLAALLEQLTARGVFARRLPAIDYAAHSPQMEPLKHALAESLADLLPGPNALPFYSTVTAAVQDGADLQAGYWAANLREPVRFGDTVQRALADGHQVFLEVHPTQVLLRPLQEGIAAGGAARAVYASLQRDADGQVALLRTLGALYVHGCPVDWAHVFPAAGNHVELPPTAWQKSRHWLTAPGKPGRRRAAGRHPFMGSIICMAAAPGTYIVQTELASSNPRFLADHSIHGAVVLPATAYIEIALEIAQELGLPGPHRLADLALEQALVLPAEGDVQLQVTVTVTATSMALEYCSRPASADDAHWTLHARGTVRQGAAAIEPVSWQGPAPDAFQAAADAVIDSTTHYQVMAAHGLEYGPAFQGIGQIWKREREALASLALPETVAAELARYQLHPVMLDLAFQSVAALLDASASVLGSQALLPVALQSLQLYHDPRQAAYAHAVLHLPQPHMHGRLIADVALLDRSGLIVAVAHGLVLQELAGAADVTQGIDRLLYQIAWEARPLADSAVTTDTAPARCLVVGDAAHLGAAAVARLAATGIACRLAPSTGDLQIDLSSRAAVERYFAALHQAGEFPDSILYLGALDAARAGATPAGEPTLIELLHLVQVLLDQAATFPRLWVVTRGAQPVDDADPVVLDQAALWGLARSIALEAPGLRCSIVDLGAAPDTEDAAYICREMLAGDAEPQLAYRGGQRLVARLVRHAATDEARPLRLAAPGEPFRLESTAPGILDRLILAGTERVPPAADQVEIRVHSAGLNFLDVLTALGLRPDQAGGAVLLGMECAGTVVQVGSDVTDFQVGDPVLAVAPHSMGAYARTLADFVALKPAGLSFQAAATIPIAYLTAYYALHTLGRIRAGERILIHAAAGGVGLAAVHLARRAGAAIYATAGSSEKRAYLQQLGVTHVMDSRTLDFADEVMQHTKGEGVDLVLNALAGDAIPRGLSTLRANGRFLEIGKRDIYGHGRLDLALLKRNIAFFAIDLIPLMAAQPAVCKEMLAEVSALVASGELPPLPVVEFPIVQAAEAFRHMAQAKHTGKIVLTLDPSTDGAPARILPRPPGAIRASGTYLISGGLGGLGLRVAGWLVAQGARHLVLLGRSAPIPDAGQAVAALTAQGARVVTVQADVGQAADVRAVLEQIAATMPPLRGVFHAAGVLDDGLLSQLDAARVRRVMASKVDGAWLLHQLTRHQELDLFVLFSSATSVLGAPGQANYAAANAFLDGLAHHRRRQGLPALAINWGAWAEVGMAARLDSAAQLARQGILAFPPQLGLAMLERCLAAPSVQVTAMQADWPRLCARFPIPLLQHLAETSSGATRPGSVAGTLASRLRGLAPAERRAAVADSLQQQVAQVLRTPAHALNPHQPLNELGIDSLMTVELVNRIETELGVTIPMSTVLQRPTSAELTELLLNLLDTSDAGAGAGVAAAENGDGFVRCVTDLASEAMLDAAVQFPPTRGTRRPAAEQILLTGATGFVGTFLLSDLLRATDARVYCLVRAADGDSGRTRLLQTLAQTFPEDEFATERIVAVPGELAQARLGLPGATFDQLAASIDLIIHSAAQVDWLAPYLHLKPANVLGTEALIRLAARRQIPIHYVSSLAIFPVVGNQRFGAIDERTSIDHGGVLYGGYTQSKWVAEKLLMAAQTRGLPGAIYRPSLIVGHSQTGAWHGNDIVAKMLRSWIELGLAPDIDVPLDLTPVDYVSRAILALLSCGQGVYHLNNPRPVAATTLIDWLVEYGYPIRKTPYAAWRDEVLGRTDIRRQAVLDSVGPLLSFQVSEEVGWLAHLPRFDNRHTQEALDPLGCPPVDRSVFRGYVDYLRKIGFLSVPV